MPPSFNLTIPNPACLNPMIRSPPTHTLLTARHHKPQNPPPPPPQTNLPHTLHSSVSATTNSSMPLISACSMRFSTGRSRHDASLTALAPEAPRGGSGGGRGAVDPLCSIPSNLAGGACAHVTGQACPPSSHSAYMRGREGDSEEHAFNQAGRHGTDDAFGV